MWQTLAEFSKETIEVYFPEDIQSSTIKFIKQIQEKDYADFVYASTSLATFFITLDSGYKGRSAGDSITFLFDSQTGQFRIDYHNNQRCQTTSYLCPEKNAESLADAFILRLFLTKDNEPLEIEPEEKPTFYLGQWVETVPGDYNKTYRIGNIYQIAKHHKQNRFMYFIEQDGKRIKKRYFKEHLKKV